MPTTTPITGARVYDIMSPAAAVASGTQIGLDDIIVKITTGTTTPVITEVGTNDWDGCLGFQIVERQQTQTVTLDFLDSSNNWAPETCTITVGNFNTDVPGGTGDPDNIRSEWS